MGKFFPQLIQGPIPRYEQLQSQLIKGNRFEERNIVKGFCYLIWGFFLNDQIFTLGLGWKEIVVLISSIVLLWKVDLYHEKGKSISDRIMAQRLVIRWGIYMIAIIGIMVFGTYGFGFNAQDFIYGGF